MNKLFKIIMTNKDLASALEWDFNAKNVNIPTLLVAGIGSVDSERILPLEGMKAIYDDIPETTMKLMIRRTNADHGDMLYYGDGYMTAWFMWLLRNDEAAVTAFTGNNAEILKNKNWQDGISNIQ